jgi:osmotically-inducible protein OsmY
MTRTALIAVATAGLLVSTSLLAHAEDPGTKLTDQQITEQVRQKLAMDDPAVAPGIFVTTRDGVVTLKGKAMTTGGIVDALHDAQSVDGVVRVDNQLKLG